MHVRCRYSNTPYIHVFFYFSFFSGAERAWLHVPAYVFHIATAPAAISQFAYELYHAERKRSPEKMGALRVTLRTKAGCSRAMTGVHGWARSPSEALGLHTGPMGLHECSHALPIQIPSRRSPAASQCTWSGACCTAWPACVPSTHVCLPMAIDRRLLVKPPELLELVKII